MLTEDCLLKFNGFTPAESTRHFLQEKISRVFEEAPSDSNLKTVIGYGEDVFKGTITIHSPIAHFFAEASDKKIKRLSEKLVEQICAQIEQWKAERFLNSEDHTLKLPVCYGKKSEVNLWNTVGRVG